MNIAIIPARGGSKRLPTKNILKLQGVPLLEYSINYAKANRNIIDKIIVSTDDLEIKKLALKNEVYVIDRPVALSTDMSSTVSAMKHVLENIEEEVDNVILLQPTNPLRPPNLLQEAYRLFNSEKQKSLMTVSRNYHKLGSIVDQKFVPYNYEPGQRSQDLEPLYHENGLLYITKASMIFQDKIMDAESFPFVVDHPFGELDIDTSEDFIKAEMYLKMYSQV